MRKTEKSISIMRRLNSVLKRTGCHIYAFGGVFELRKTYRIGPDLTTEAPVEGWRSFNDMAFGENSLFSKYAWRVGPDLAVLAGCGGVSELDLKMKIMGI